MSRKPRPKRRRKNQPRRARRAAPRRRKVAAPQRKPTPRRKPKRTQKVLPSTPLLEIAVREMNRGQSLTATAQSLKLPSANLQKILRERGLLKRKGKRWVTKDNRLRRVPVMTGGRVRKLTVRGYQPASLVSEHHLAAGEFVRTNDIKLIKPFKGRTVQAVNGRLYVLETDPNALHRIAAMDTPPFHEIYKITSNT